VVGGKLFNTGDHTRGGAGVRRSHARFARKKNHRRARGSDRKKISLQLRCKKKRILDALEQFLLQKRRAGARRY